MKKTKFIRMYEQFRLLNESKLVEPKFIVVNERGTEIYENFEEAYEFIKILHEELSKLAPDDSVCNLEYDRMLNRVYNTASLMVEKLREKYQLPLDNPDLNEDKNKVEQIRQWINKNSGLGDTEFYNLADSFAKQIGVTVDLIRRVKMFDFKTKSLKRKFDWNDKKVSSDPINKICQIMMNVAGSWLRCCKNGEYICHEPRKFSFPPLSSNVSTNIGGGVAPVSDTGGTTRSGDTYSPGRATY